MARTYSKGESVLEKSSAVLGGMISMFGRPSSESICRRRGDEDARTMRFVRSKFSTGMDSGGGRGRSFFFGGGGAVVVVAVRRGGGAAATAGAVADS